MFWLKSGLDWLVVTMEEEEGMMMVLSGTFLDSRDERNDELLLGVLGENKTLLSLLVAGSEKSCVRY